MKKLSLYIAIAAAALYGLSLAADAAGIYTLAPQYQRYLLAAAMIAAGIFVLKTVKQIIVAVIFFAVAAYLIFSALQKYGFV